jgi:hypothetical protein
MVIDQKSTPSDNGGMTTKAAHKAHATRRAQPAYRALQLKYHEDIVWLCEMAAGRATNRHITPGPVARFLREDMAIRKALDAMIRLWKPPHSYISVGAAKAAKGAGLEREHVIPVRMLIDRMITEPSECRALLGKAVVIAHVTPAEHKQLVLSYKDPLYDRMLKAHVSRLRQRGLDRYRAMGIELVETS